MILGWYGVPFFSNVPGPSYWEIMLGRHCPVTEHCPAHTPTSISCRNKYKLLKINMRYVVIYIMHYHFLFYVSYLCSFFIVTFSVTFRGTLALFNNCCCCHSIFATIDCNCFFLCWLALYVNCCSRRRM